MSRSVRSPIWNFFTKEASSGIAKCNICKHKLSYKSSTSNLKKHMTSRHPTVCIDTMRPELFLKQKFGSDDEDGVRPVKMPMLEKTVPSAALAEFNPEDFRQSTGAASTAASSETVHDDEAVMHLPKTTTEQQQNKVTPARSKSIPLRQQTLSAYIPKKVSASQKTKIDEALMKLFTKDFQPFSIVEDEGFVEYTNTLNPSYVLPSRKVLSKTMLPAKFEECLNNTKYKIGKAKTLCLTTDCWTSQNTDSFMAVTAHFIDDEFDFHSAILQLEQLHERHTSVNLADALRELARVWDIGQKVMLVVSDNASNITKAVRDILEWKHFGCFAHSINLVVKDGLSSNQNVEILLHKIRTIVSYFKRSTTSTERLIRYQRKNNDPKNPPKKLIQDVPTRWNSTFLMLKRFVLLHEPLKATMALLDKDLPGLSQCEWKMACELMICLKPFFSITESVSGEKYATASLVIPLSNSLKAVISKLKRKNFSPDIQAVVDRFSKGIMDRFGPYENSQTLTLVTFLDPRFKNLCFSNPETTEKVKKRAVGLVASHMRTAVCSKETINETPRNENIRSKSTDELSVFASLEQLLSQKKTPGTNESRAIVEIDRYIEDDNLERHNDPLLWWKTEGHQYPHIRQIVQKYFCCLATSVPCERTFSKAAMFISERRNRLSGNNAKMLIFLNQNQDFEERKPVHRKEMTDEQNDAEDRLNKIINHLLNYD